jgi:pyrimidine oxygenase
MGLWPGEVHFARRYDYLTEYVTIMQDLWTTGRSDFKGQYFTMNDCRLSPRPPAPIKLICAGQSDRGMQFAADHCDINFCSASGMNTPASCIPTVSRLHAESQRAGRGVAAYLLLMIIADETDEAALAKWEHYKTGVDIEALSWAANQAGADKQAAANSTAGLIREMGPNAGAERLLPTRMGRLIGSYASVARMLDEIAAIPGVGGVMLTFDDFLIGLEQFGHRIQPLMASRRNHRAAA